MTNTTMKQLHSFIIASYRQWALQQNIPVLENYCCQISFNVCKYKLSHFPQSCNRSRILSKIHCTYELCRIVMKQLLLFFSFFFFGFLHACFPKFIDYIRIFIIHLYEMHRSETIVVASKQYSNSHWQSTFRRKICQF